MTLEELFEKLYNNRIYEDIIVRLKYKYAHEDEWIYSNEILEYAGDIHEYCWLYDWNEGQQDVVVLGYIPVDEIKIEEYNKKEIYDNAYSDTSKSGFQILMENKKKDKDYSLQDIIRVSNSHYGIYPASHNNCIDTMINYIGSRYHTCGNCKYDTVPEKDAPCVNCIHSMDMRKDLWTPKKEETNHEQ